MSKPILVTYASRYGSTADVARRISAALKGDGADVDLLPMADVAALEPYRAVIIGSAVRRGAWLPEAVSFLRRFEAGLINTPAAYFTVCATLRDDTPENRRVVSEYHDPLFYDFTDIEPVSIGMFAGALDYDRLPWYHRLYARVARLPGGDWRDGAKVDAWARKVLPLLA
jgi:menaquinone-dependent protoporphyrinogen oxidase